MSNSEPVNILLVDDQPAKLLSYETVLADLGDNLIRASSGKQALEILLKTDIAVVLVDVCMPELDGFELAAMIRAHPRFHKTAIILVSGILVEDAHRLKGYGSGAVDYVSVPIVPEILRAKVAIFADLFRKTKELVRLNEQLEARSDELQQELGMRLSAEERLRQYATELERSNLELEQFASVASHDLQEPLRMIVSFVQLLAEGHKGKLSPEGNEFIGYVVEGATRMKQLISDLRDYSRVRGNPIDLESTDCEAVMRSALMDLSLAIENKNAVITNDPLPTVVAEASQMGQLFQNLLANAIKFSGPQAPRIHVSARENEDTWLFSVRDNGIGIGREHHERVFEIFQRLHGYNEYPGTGIGLAICKKIVEGHGGRIWVESDVGQGSTFFFSLPAASKEPPTRDGVARAQETKAADNGLTPNKSVYAKQSMEVLPTERGS